MTLSREPGSKVEYSTFGIGLLGHIITLKSNMSSLDELLNHNILDVLGMNDTSSSFRVAKISISSGAL